MEVLRSWALPLTLLLLPVASCHEVTGVSFAEAENNGFARGVDNLPLAGIFGIRLVLPHICPNLRGITRLSGLSRLRKAGQSVSALGFTC